jgi:phenylacetic acid degradation protein
MAQVYAFEGLVPVVDPDAYVHPTATLIGDVIVAAGCYVGPGAVMRGDFGRLMLEFGSNLQDTCVVHGFPNSDTVIMENGHVGHGAVLHGCVVGRNALIGMNAVVMDGALIGEDAFVAAQAFVKAGLQVPARALVAGIPGRVVRMLTADEIAWKSEGTLEYQRLARRSLRAMVPCQPLARVEPNRRRAEVATTDPFHLAKSKFQ